MNTIFNPNFSLKIRLGYTAILVLMLFGLSAVYLYIRTTPQKLFSENYHSYQLHVARGNGEKSMLKEAYASGNMDSVVQKFYSTNSPVQEEYLLAGIAFLEKGQAPKAIEIFQKLILKNIGTQSDFFEDDAEYYLAMSYLNNNEISKAMPIFEKIQADSEHPYNSYVSEWFLLNVKNSVAKK